MSNYKIEERNRNLSFVFYVFLVIVILTKLNMGASGVEYVKYMFEKIMFLILPLSISFCLYRQLKYYENTFIRIRSKHQLLWKKQIIKECFLVVLYHVLLLYVMIFVGNFTLTLQYLIYFFSLLLYTITFFLCLISIFMISYFYQGKQAALLLLLACSYSYALVIIRFQVCFEFNVFYHEPLVLYRYIILFTVITAVLSARTMDVKKGIEKAGLLGMMISSFAINYLVQSNIGLPSFMSFPEIFFISPLELILPFTTWCLMIGIIVFFTLQQVLTEYRSNFLFYAIRIKNRKKWMISCMKKLCIRLWLMLCLNLCVYFVIHPSFDVTLFYVLCTAYFFLLGIVLLTFILYQVVKNDRVFIYTMIAYIVIAVVSIIANSDYLMVLLRQQALIYVVACVLIDLALYQLCSYALNHLDYY